jgi:HEAT repeat protein
VTIASAAVQLVNPIYNDWLAELVPANSRGWFFSRRMMIATVVGAVGGFLGGLALDAFRRANDEAVGFAVIFGFGVLSAAVSMAMFFRMVDGGRANPIRKSLRESLFAFRDPIRDPAFRPVLVFFFVFILGQAFAGNLFSAFALETLNMPFAVIQATGISVAVASVATARMWGYFADKYGNKPIVAILGFGLFLTPAMWLFCQPGAPVANAVILIAGHLFSGAVWAGISVCQFNLLLATAKPEDRANYIGVGMALQALTGALSPMLGALLMGLLRHSFAPDVAYKIVFGSTMALRLVAIGFLVPVVEKGSTSIRATLKHLSKVSPRGYKALKQLSQSADVETRASAIASVGRQNFGIAVDEILKSLHDPSPRLRRQAAAALAKMDDPRATEALIHQITDHPALVEEETIEALGDLGNPDAIPHLARYLDSMRSQLRRAAAHALAKIGDPSAVEPLVRACQKPNDPDLRYACLQALRALEAREAEEAITDALFDPHPSVRIAAAEAIADLDLRGARPVLRESLTWYDDEAASEVAYALGAVGEVEDLSLILETAQKCVSIITRRRCLLGVARMLGVESEVYRLFLQEGMSRDAALLDSMKTHLRGQRALRQALDCYSSGDEAAALRHLAEWRRRPEFLTMAEHPVEESFLVAVSAAVIRPQRRVSEGAAER